MARKHTLKLRELRGIRVRFVIILSGMTIVTLMILAYLALRVFIVPDNIVYVDFVSLCFYGTASLVMTVAQIVFLRHLTLGAGKRLAQLAYTDELTGLGNPRHIAKFLAEEFREAQLSGNPLTVVLLDLDDFKQVNDQHGHKAGDLVLQAVGHALKNTVREADFVGRAGGDEFVLILPDTDSQSASVVAHRIVERINDIAITIHSVSGESTALTGLTASMGISSYPVNANAREALVEDADRTMYAAKNTGKANIVISITRPAGPEPRASVRHITKFATQINGLLGQPREQGTPEERGDG